jgi:hypothetical protein
MRGDSVAEESQRAGILVKDSTESGSQCIAIHNEWFGEVRQL